MKRKTIIVFLVLAALAAGYYFGTLRSSPGDPVNAASTIVPLRQVVTSAPQPTAKPKSSSQEYVLNTNTKKFHYPSCPSVDQMKDKNKKVVTWSRQQIINEGYSSCGRCKP